MSSNLHLARAHPLDEEETVMVAVSSDPTDGQQLIQKGLNLARHCNALCYVVYVRQARENVSRLHWDLQHTLNTNLNYAAENGAIVVQLEGDNVSEVLVNFASEYNIRHAVFGKSRLSPLRERLRGSFILDFLYDAVGVDVHIVNTTPREAT